MSDDLKERLRELDQKYRSVGIILCDDFKEAADRIEALEAQLAEAQADRDAAVAAALEEACDTLQEAVDDWRSTGNELPARKIEDEIPHIRALIPQSGADALERARAVAVKPLAWEEDKYGLVAKDPSSASGAKYRIYPTPKGSWVLGGVLVGMEQTETFDTLEAAKAAAQAHYERRIRSALVHVTPDMLAEARAAGMREAADLFTAHPWSWNKHEIRASILAAIEKGEG